MSAATPHLSSQVGGSHPLVVSRRIRELAALSIGALFAVALALAITVESPNPEPVLIFGLLAGVACTVALMMNTRYEVTLLILGLYLGLLDGPVKLLSNSKAASGVRDILIVAFVLGMLMRLVVRKERVRLPALGGWVVAFTVVVLIEALNPNTSGITKTLGGYRQLLEWVPFFFLGYGLFHNKQRFRQLFLVLGVIALANGLVGVVQARESPTQLAQWGPGYRTLSFGGEGGLTARTYAVEGEAKPRPPALGSDAGFGGAVGVLALPGLLALLAVGRSRRRWPVYLCAIGAVLGIATAASRTSVIIAVITLMTFGALSLIARLRMSRALAGLLGMLALTLVVGSVLIASQGSSIFARQETLTSLQSAQESGGRGKEQSISELPHYLAAAPFGLGLGITGSVSGFGGSQKVLLEGKKVMGGDAYSLLQKETGVVGFSLWIAFSFNVILLAGRGLRRIRDSELRTYLVAILTAFITTTMQGFSGPTLGVTIGAFLWLAPGIIAYWFAGPGKTAMGTSSAMSTSSEPMTTNTASAS